MMSSRAFIPYCGGAPAPGGVAWNFDPVLLAVLAAMLAAYIWRGIASPDIAWPRRFAFYGGWTVLAAAMISPLCNLGVALFSARIVQHMAVSFVAAPLIVVGRADRIFLNATRAVRPRRWAEAASPPLFAAVLWFWHLAGPYDAALRNNLLYWCMDLSMFFSALFLWWTVLHSAQERPGSSLIASLFTGIQMCVLGALLTLSNHAWFTVHAATTWAWGLSPLDDQQLGGLVMWVPGGIVLTGFTILLLGRHLAVQPKPLPPSLVR